MKKTFKRKLLRIVLFTFLMFLALTAALFILIQQPKVQTFVVNQVTRTWSEKTGSRMEVGRVDVRFFNRLELQDVLIMDQNMDSLLSAKDLLLTISFINPFKKTYHFSKAKMDGVRFHAIREDADGPFNFEFLAGLFMKEETDAIPVLPDLTIGTIELNSFDLYLEERYAGKSRRFKFGQFILDVDKLDLNKKVVMIDRISLRNPEASFVLPSSMKSEEDADTTRARPLAFLETGWKIGIGEFKVFDGSLELKDKEGSVRNELTDIRNISIRDLQVDISGLRFDSLAAMQVNNISFDESDRLVVSGFQAGMNLGRKGAGLEGLSVDLNNSHLSTDLHFTYEDLNSLIDDPESIYLNGQIDLDRIEKDDIVRYFPAYADYLHDIRLKTEIYGTLGNVRAKNLRLEIAQKSSITANFNIKGLPDFQNSLISAEILDLSTDPSDIREILHFIELPEDLAELGNIRFKGEFYGHPDDFVAYGDLQTDIGDLKSDLKLNLDGRDPEYSGKFSGSSLKLGDYLGINGLQDIDFELNIDGKGLELASLHSEINGSIPQMTYNGITYDSIRVSGLVDERIFTGNLSVKDDCVLLDFEGLADFQDSIPRIESRLNIRNADLQALNFMEDKLIVSLNGDVHLTGNKLSNLNGNLSLNDLSLENDEATFKLDSTRIDLRSERGFKYYTLSSGEFNGHMEGDFDLMALPREIPRMLSNYSGFINVVDTTEMIPQRLYAELRIKEDFSLLKFFLKDFETVSEMDMEFTFDNVLNEFDLSIQTDTVRYGKFSLKDFYLKSDLNEKLELTAHLDRITMNDKLSFNWLGARVLTDENELLTKLSIENDTSLNLLRLDTRLLRSGQDLIVTIPFSEIKLNDKVWTIKESNELIIRDSVFVAKDLRLVQGEQAISILNGTTSLSELEVVVDRLNLYDVGQLLMKEELIRSGKLDGNIRLVNPINSLEADLDISVFDLQILDYEADYIGVDGIYVNDRNEIILAASITDEDYDLTLTGFYDFDADEYEAADINVNVDRVNLNFIEEFLKGNAEINAFARGDIKFRGSFSKPIMDGRAEILDTASFYISYLGTEYTFANEEVIFRENLMDYGFIKLYDEEGRSADVIGKMTHQYFRDMILDLYIRTDEFTMMNTTARDNELYHGHVIGAGDIRLGGPTRNLAMDIQVTTLDGTEFNIAAAAQEDVKEYTFITFVDPDDTLGLEARASEYEVDLKGISLRLGIDVTQDARLSILLGSEDGNEISGTAEGSLDLVLDNNGEFNIYGTLNIIKGKYLLTLQNFIPKTFNVQPGSIAWNGDVMDAELDIEAIYRTKANFNLDTTATSSSFNQKIPVNVVLLMQGTLMEPQINFDIQIPQDQRTTATEQADLLIREIRDDQNELNTQVFGLLIFNRFLPVGNVFASTNASFASEFGRNTAWEFLSTQLSAYLNSLINQFSDNVEIGVEISQSEDYIEGAASPSITQELDLVYTHRLLDERLIINVGGSFEFYDREATTTEQANAGIAGDFEVEYVLTEDGRIRIKAFHRRFDNDIFNEDRSKTGIGLLLQKDFNKFPELFESDRRKNRRKKFIDERQAEGKEEEEVTGTDQ